MYRRSFRTNQQPPTLANVQRFEKPPVSFAPRAIRAGGPAFNRKPARNSGFRVGPTILKMPEQTQRESPKSVSGSGSESESGSSSESESGSGSEAGSEAGSGSGSESASGSGSESASGSGSEALSEDRRAKRSGNRNRDRDRNRNSSTKDADWVVMRVLATTDVFTSPDLEDGDDVRCCGEIPPGSIVACQRVELGNKSPNSRGGKGGAQSSPFWVRVGTIDGSSKYALAKDTHMVQADRPDGRDVQMYSILTRLEEMTRILADLVVEKLERDE